MVKVLFVCLGNICRSPTAHGVFEKIIADNGLSTAIQVDSAGTGNWHIGRAPDSRSCDAAAQRGYDLSHLRARQVTPADFEYFDYILAMDGDNLSHLLSIAPSSYEGHLGLFMDFAGPTRGVSVPDPYYGGSDGFSRVVDMVEKASRGLLQHIAIHHAG